MKLLAEICITAVAVGLGVFVGRTIAHITGRPEVGVLACIVMAYALAYISVFHLEPMLRKTS